MARIRANELAQAQAFARPAICMGCERPLSPHRFVDGWPLNGGQCDCDADHGSLPVADDALASIATVDELFDRAEGEGRR